MKKIKKLDKLKLNNEEMSNIYGGGWWDDVKDWFSTLLPTRTPAPPITCKCGCAGCIWDDGGAGFSVGMMHNNYDGG